MRAVVVPAIQQIGPRHCISKGYKSSDQQRPNTCRDHYKLFFLKKYSLAQVSDKDARVNVYHVRLCWNLVYAEVLWEKNIVPQLKSISE